MLDYSVLISALQQSESVIYIYAYIFIFFSLTAYPRLLFPLLYSTTLLIIHSICSSLPPLTKKSQSIPFPSALLLGNDKYVLCVWESVLYVGSLMTYFTYSIQSLSSVRPLWPQEQQHTRPQGPSPSPRVQPNPCPLSGWCYWTISSFVISFSSCPNPSQHQGLFKWVSSSHQLAKVLKFQHQHQSFQWTPKTELL